MSLIHISSRGKWIFSYKCYWINVNILILINFICHEILVGFKKIISPLLSHFPFIVTKKSNRYVAKKVSLQKKKKNMASNGKKFPTYSSSVSITIIYLCLLIYKNHHLIDLERAANWRPPRAAKVLGTPLRIANSPFLTGGRKLSGKRFPFFHVN